MDLMMDREAPAQPSRDDDRIPVILSISDILSGVDSWAWRLEKAFRDHPRYRIALLGCNSNPRENPRFKGWANWEWQVRRFLKQHAAGPSIVIPNYLWQVVPLACERIKQGQRIACVGFCHSDSTAEYYTPLEWFEPIFSRFVAVSETCSAQLRRNLAHRAEDVRLATYGVEIGPEPSMHSSTGPLKLIYAGRMVQEQKCVFDLVDLVRHLEERKVDFRMSLVGEGVDEKELAKRMAPYADKVQMVGAKPNDAMPALYSAHDVFVQVSSYEGTSNSLLEAMACGTLPAVTAIESGVRGIVEDGESGVLIPPGDMESLAGRLEQLAENRPRLAQMGHATWERAQAFSIERNVEALAEVFDAALAEPQRFWPEGRSLRLPRPVYGGLIGWPRRYVKLRQFLRRIAGRV